MVVRTKSLLLPSSFWRARNKFRARVCVCVYHSLAIDCIALIDEHHSCKHTTASANTTTEDSEERKTKSIKIFNYLHSCKTVWDSCLVHMLWGFVAQYGQSDRKWPRIHSAISSVHDCLWCHWCVHVSAVVFALACLLSTRNYNTISSNSFPSRGLHDLLGSLSNLPNAIVCSHFQRDYQERCCDSASQSEVSNLTIIIKGFTVQFGVA